MLTYRYDTQLLIEGENLDEDEINSYFRTHFDGDSLLAVGRGMSWNIALRLAKFTILLWKIWIGSHGDCRDKQCKRTF